MPVTYLINASFFVGELNIPNTTSGTAAGIGEKLAWFIAKYEPECLLKILGYPLFKLFGTETSQRMTQLKDGAEYTVNGELRKWQGLVHDDLSLIAAYVYYFYMYSTATASTNMATGKMKVEAGISVSPQDKMVSAFNFFSSEVEAMLYFLWNKKDDNGDRVYPEFSHYQFCQTRNLSRPINTFGF